VQKNDAIDLSSSDDDLPQDGEGSASSEDEEFKANFDLPLGQMPQNVNQSSPLSHHTQGSRRKKNKLIKETAKEQEDRIRLASPFGHLKSWRLFRFIVKSNDDVR